MSGQSLSKIRLGCSIRDVQLGDLHSTIATLRLKTAGPTHPFDQLQVTLQPASSTSELPTEHCQTGPSAAPGPPVFAGATETLTGHWPEADLHWTHPEEQQATALSALARPAGPFLPRRPPFPSPPSPASSFFNSLFFLPSSSTTSGVLYSHPCVFRLSSSTLALFSRTSYLSPSLSTHAFFYLQDVVKKRSRGRLAIHIECAPPKCVLCASRWHRS